MLVFNELRYAYRQPLVVMASIAALLISVVIGMGAIHEKVSINELYQAYAILQMLVTPAAFTVIAVATLLRDKTSNMMELIDSTPITFRKRWLLRVLTTTSIVSLPFIIGFGVISVFFAMVQGDSLQSIIGFFAISFGTIVPNALLLTSLVLLILKFSDSSFTIYAFSSAFSIVYIFIGSILGFPFLSGSAIVSEGFYNVMLWLDPYGITPLLHYTETNALSSAEFLTNRVLTIAVCCSLLILLTSNKNSVYLPNLVKAKAKEKTLRKISLTRYLNTISPRTVISRLVLTNVKVLASSKITQVLFAVWAAIVLNEVLSTLLTGGIEKAANSNTNSIIALNAVAFDVYLVFTSACLALWSWKICWENKRLDFDGIIAATPINNIQKVMADFISLSILLGLLTIIMAAASLVAELLAGSDIIFSHYLLQLLLSFIPQALLAIIFVCIHHLLKSPEKAGSVIFMILLVKYTPIMASLGATHLLWNIAGSPIQPASQYWSFLASMNVYLPFTLFWLMVGISMTLIAVKVSHRGTGYVMVKSKLNNTAKVIFALTLAVGAAIHFQLVAEKPLTYVMHVESWKKGYEETFKHYSTIPQPKITAINSNVDLYPESGFAQFTVDYRLTNESNEIISNILVGRHGNLVDWSLATPLAKAKQSKRQYNHTEIQLDEPLKSGDSLELSIHFNVRQPQLWPSSENLIISEQFTRISAEYFLPVVGYQPSFEIKGKQQRTALGLPEQSSPDALPAKVLVNSTVSTTHNHTIVPIGALVDKQIKDHRNVYQFTSTTPKSLDFSWVSTPAKPFYEKGNKSKTMFFTPAKSRVPSTLIKSAVSDSINWLAINLPLLSANHLSVIYTPVLESDIQSKDSTLFLKSDWVFKLAPISSEEYSAEHYAEMVRAVIMSMINPYNTDSRMQQLMASIIQLKIMSNHLGNKKLDEYLLRISSQHDNLHKLSKKTSATEQVASSLLKLQSMLVAQTIVSEVPHHNVIEVITQYLDSNINLFSAKELLSNKGLLIDHAKQKEVTRMVQSYFTIH